jgi:RNA polymerase sigma-70 factor (ECF subfamily)
MPDQASESLILERVAAGDEAALDLLMSRYAARAYRLARGITRSDADAEEVVQDVFLSIVRKSATFEGRAALGSWIHRITTNAALNRRRGKRWELETSLEECLPTFLGDGHREGDRAYLLADWSRNPEEELLSGEARDVLARALDRLPDHYRAVLVMRDVEGLSNEETAQVLGETVPSVKSKLHRARMALRERLTQHFAGVPARRGTGP